MTNYFDIHFPFHIKPYTVRQVGEEHHYIDEKATETGLRGFIDETFYQLVQDMVKQAGRTTNRIFVRISGSFIELLQRYRPDVLPVLQSTCRLRQVVLLETSYYHTCSNYVSSTEWRAQADLHRRLVEALFTKTPVAQEGARQEERSIIEQAFLKLLSLETRIKESGDESALYQWRVLTDSSYQVPGRLDAKVLRNIVADMEHSIIQGRLSKLRFYQAPSIILL